MFSPLVTGDMGIGIDRYDAGSVFGGGGMRMAITSRRQRAGGGAATVEMSVGLGGPGDYLTGRGATVVTG
jgi:hypothetical protein